jgi:hypothetical protein
VGGAQQRLNGSRAGAGALQLREPAAKPRVVGAAGHHHRRHGLGAPQLVDLGQERLEEFCSDPDWVVVGGHVLGGGVHQDKGAGAVWSGRGEEDRGRTSVELAHDGGPLGANLVQDRRQFLGIRLPGG